MPYRLCPILLLLRECYNLLYGCFWWFCKHLVVLHLEGVVFSTTLINSLFFLVFSVYQKKKNKTTPGLGFSLRSTIKAHIRLQSHLNFWTAGFIILCFRKRAWFYGIDSNSLACPDILWEPWCAQTDEESFEFMRTWSHSGFENLSLCHQCFSNYIEMSLGTQYMLPKMEVVSNWDF